MILIFTEAKESFSWGLVSWTRDQTRFPLGAWDLNHWTIRKVPPNLFFFFLVCGTLAPQPGDLTLWPWHWESVGVLNHWPPYHYSLVAPGKLRPNMCSQMKLQWYLTNMSLHLCSCLHRNPEALKHVREQVDSGIWWLHALSLNTFV